MFPSSNPTISFVTRRLHFVRDMTPPMAAAGVSLIDLSLVSINRIIAIIKAKATMGSRCLQ